MTLKKRLTEEYTLRNDPGDPEPEPCAPGSIEQALDMCEEGSLKGDDILYNHGKAPRKYSGTPEDLTYLTDRANIDISEEDREGDEMSGDDHSSGLQGGESEIQGQSHIDTGMPGNRTQHEEQDFEIEEATAEGKTIPKDPLGGGISIKKYSA